MTASHVRVGTSGGGGYPEKFPLLSPLSPMLPSPSSTATVCYSNPTDHVNIPSQVSSLFFFFILFLPQHYVLAAEPDTVSAAAAATAAAAADSAPPSLSSGIRTK